MIALVEAVRALVSCTHPKERQKAIFVDQNPAGVLPGRSLELRKLGARHASLCMQCGAVLGAPDGEPDGERFPTVIAPSFVMKVGEAFETLTKEIGSGPTLSGRVSRAVGELVALARTPEFLEGGAHEGKIPSTPQLSALLVAIHEAVRPQAIGERLSTDRLRAFADLAREQAERGRAAARADFDRASARAAERAKKDKGDS